MACALRTHRHRTLLSKVLHYSSCSLARTVASADLIFPALRMPLTLAFISGMVMDLFTVTERMPDRGETLMALQMEQHPGGKGCNASIAAHRYSRVNPNGPRAMEKMEVPAEDEIHVRVVGAIGDDAYGQDCLVPLKASNIDVSGIRVLEGQRTGISTIIVEQDCGENRILQTPGANAHLRPSDFATFESLAGGLRPDLLTTQIELPRDTVEHILRIAHKHGISTLLNPSPAQVVLEEVLREVTHLVVNESEAALLSGMDLDDLRDIHDWDKVTADFLSVGVRNVVLTLGARGAYYANALGEKGHVLAEQVDNVVDPSGAGDTFVGAYAVEYVRQKRRGEWDIKYAVERACKAAARIIQKVGCQDATPWMDEIDRNQDKVPPDVSVLEIQETVPNVAERLVGEQEVIQEPVQFSTTEPEIVLDAGQNPVVEQDAAHLFAPKPLDVVVLEDDLHKVN